MILLTGGAGFIGSNLLARLNASGVRDVVICDELGKEGKWRNLQKREFLDFISIQGLKSWLEHAPKLDAVVHLGAISETAVSDADRVMDRNYGSSLMLWRHCAAHDTPFVYASSAATYGDGEHGFEDADDPGFLAGLRPASLYGWSKHIFDRFAAGSEARGEPTPPRWYGLKFFNVYGPNEYHKGRMRSVVYHITEDLLSGKPAAKLFCSDRPDVPDGAQSRDFVYVDDVCDVLAWLLRAGGPSGIYNVGSGTARSFLDLAHAVFAALGREPAVDFVPLPDDLHGRYQYWTKGDIAKLRRAGYNQPMTGLEEGVRKYVTQYLLSEDRYV
jgi:ADP-L-glycero-D-manno-heptose 6-epimerase